MRMSDPYNTRMKGILLWLFLTFSSMSAHAQVLFNFQDGATVELDGRYYVMLGGTISATVPQGYVVAAPMSMDVCTRPGGAALVVTSRPFTWGSPPQTIYLTTANNPDGSSGIRYWYPFDRGILVLRSSSDDLSCAGDVPPPPGLFRNGFE